MAKKTLYEVGYLLPLDQLRPVIDNIRIVFYYSPAMEREYFLTWDRPEYKEWASPIEGGYELHIIRQEPDNYLVVKAKLVMGEKGLPGFEVLEEHHLPDEQAASGKVQEWRDALK